MSHTTIAVGNTDVTIRQFVQSALVNLFILSQCIMQIGSFTYKGKMWKIFITYLEIFKT